ncbi:MAG TPA: SLBB domain-containing protein [Candidatus Eisenbacteria bacterium]|nr:SLBB domain-containing protein [Candidatus Eisenbacteria bacterium]
MGRAVLILLALAAWASLAAAQSMPQGTTDVPEVGSLGQEGPQLPTTIIRPVEDPTKAPLPALSGPVDPKVYRVGPGDLLQIQIWGRTSRNWSVTVGPEGYILVPGAGSMAVSGRTLAEVRNDVVKKLSQNYRGVGIDLRLARPRVFQVYVTGQVRSPGPLQAMGSHRVADVLQDGAFLDDASRRRIEVVHADGTRENADLVVFTRTGNSEANPELRDGDVINVPVASEWISAQGALGRPGRYELGLADSLLTLFHLAGEPIPSAVIDKVLFIRWQDPTRAESLWVRLDDVYDRRMNPALRDGDRLYVYYIPQYHLQHEVVIQGEVSRPGTYPIAEGKHRLTDLVRAAEGFLPTADLTSIRVHRRNSSTGEKDPELDRLLQLPRSELTDSEYDKLSTKLAGMREDYRVDWTRLNANSDQQDLLLRDGDIVRVERLVSSIRIDGEVKRPGILSFRPGLKVNDYVKQAGGLTDRAWGGNIRVTRAVTGQTLPARNVQVLDPGDFVWVPEKPDRGFWDYATPILVALAQVATVVIAVDSLNE